MRIIKIMFLGITLLCGCRLSAGEVLKDGPFSGVDLSTLSTNHAAIIRNANEDFVLVLNGHAPSHAVIDQKWDPVSDGGTSVWVATGYRLTISKSLSSFGNLTGYIYGPILVFESGFAPGNTDRVVNLRFYTPEQLRQLEKNANQAMHQRPGAGK